MWTDELGTERAETKEEPKREERRVERASTGGPLRWLFVFDGWRLDQSEEEFVLA